MRLTLPTWATTILALIAGVIAVLNQATFDFVQPWHAALTVGLVLLAGLGIGPLTGGAFRNALHLPQNATVAITAVIGAATVGVATLSMPIGVRSVIVGVLTVLAGLGFGTVPVATTPVPVPAPVPPVK